MSRIRSIHRVKLDAIPNERAAAVRYLYVIAQEGSDAPCKVGYAAHPVWRKFSLQSGNPRRLILCAAWHGPSAAIKRLEADAHEALAGWPVGNSEWFAVSHQMATTIIQELINEALT